LIPPLLGEVRWGIPMHLIFRMAKTVLKARFGSKLEPTDESVLQVRCWPNDLDANLHMTNGRYLTVMDLGKFDLWVRAGLFKELMIKRKWRPILGAANIHFKAPIHLFEVCTLRTRIAGWDDKWFFLEHRLEVRGKLAALSIQKGLFREPGRSVPSAELIAALNLDMNSVEMPAYISAWLAAEPAFEEALTKSDTSPV